MQNGRIAGSLLLIGCIQFILGVIISEALYPGYSISNNYISDLGVGPSSLIFNSSIVLLGMLLVGTTYFVNRIFDIRIFSLCIFMAGIGAIGVGLFTESAGVSHTIFSFITLFFGGLSAIMSYKILKFPFSFYSVILGSIVILALILFSTNIFLGLGKGGMERMIAYPALLWGVALGAHLLNNSNIK